MPNERLRSVMLERGVTPAELAVALEVDPKSVERWVKGRTPYRRHRYAVAAHLGVDEAYLWPDALTSEQVASAAESEIINVYAHRWMVPMEVFRELFGRAGQDVGVLVYSGIFLAEDAGVQRVLRERAGAAVRVRVLLGDPECEPVAQRGADEGIGDDMAARIRNALVLHKPLREVEGIEFRLHATILYNSIFWSDDQVLVNTHIYGFPASLAPVLHLRRVAGGDMVSTYLDSFERVWDGAVPVR